jgi:hypothetical protein
MAREYIIPATNITVANQAVTLVFFQAATAAGSVCALEVLRVAVSQAANATSAQQRVQMSTQVTAFPTLTSQAPLQLKALDPASKITGGTAGAAGTSGINASAEGAGGKTVVLPDAFNVLNGYLWVPTPAETIIESAAATAHGFGLVFPAAPATLTAWNAYLVFREIG